MTRVSPYGAEYYPAKDEPTKAEWSKVLNAIADKVLRYRPKAKSKASRRRKRRAAKLRRSK